MSKKKHKNRGRNDSFNSFERTNESSGTDSSSSSIQTNVEPIEFGRLAYLKKHWWAVGLVALLSLGAFGAGWKFLDENANQTMANTEASTPLNPAEETLLSKINPLVPAVSPSPTPQLSKEYIYAGSRLLAVEDANANAAPPADLAIWRPSSGAWWVMGGQGSQQITQSWGASGDVPVPGDYDGDGKTDFAIFRPDTVNHLGNWYLLYSATNSWTSIQWGLDSDQDNLTPADFDGDGKTDLGLWRASNGFWYILKSSDNQALSLQYGSSGDKPAPADYDGDGKADAAVWRSSNSTFYSLNSSNVAAQTVAFSQTSTEPVSADYDGDGKADYAIRNSTNWIIRSSSNNQTQTVSWQLSSDKAVHNDYDGDGKVDIAVWRGAESSPGANDVGRWYIRKSGSGGTLRQETWGIAGDIPVPAFYRR